MRRRRIGSWPSTARSPGGPDLRAAAVRIPETWGQAQILTAATEHPAEAMRGGARFALSLAEARYLANCPHPVPRIHVAERLRFESSCLGHGCFCRLRPGRSRI